MSIIPARHNFSIYQGATFYTRITYSVNGETPDLSAYSASLELKNEPKGERLLLVDTPIGATRIILGEKGLIDIQISDATTSTLTWETAVYELFLTSPEGRIDVILRGGFKVVPF